jgi:hypothetical protein
MTHEDTITAYCAAWDEPDRKRREKILDTVWAEAATYTDPTVHAVGKTQLIEHIDKVLARYPGSRIVRTSALDTHQGLARFTWKKVLADGTSLPEGIDFAEFEASGKLTRIIGFFGPLRPFPASC